MLVLIVVWGSLQTAFGGPTVHGFDKVQHFSTYMFLAAWFVALQSQMLSMRLMGCSKQC